MQAENDNAEGQCRDWTAMLVSFAPGSATSEVVGRLLGVV